MSKKDDFIEILEDPVTSEFFQDPLLWDGHVFSRSVIQGVLNTTAYGKEKPTVNHPFTRDTYDKTTLMSLVTPSKIIDNLVKIMQSLENNNNNPILPTLSDENFDSIFSRIICLLAYHNNESLENNIVLTKLKDLVRFDQHKEVTQPLLEEQLKTLEVNVAKLYEVINAPSLMEDNHASKVHSHTMLNTTQHDPLQQNLGNKIIELLADLEKTFNNPSFESTPKHRIKFIVLLMQINDFLKNDLPPNSLTEEDVAKLDQFNKRITNMQQSIKSNGAHALGPISLDIDRYGMLIATEIERIVSQHTRYVNSRSQLETISNHFQEDFSHDSREELDPIIVAAADQQIHPLPNEPVSTHTTSSTSSNSIASTHHESVAISSSPFEKFKDNVENLQLLLKNSKKPNKKVAITPKEIDDKMKACIDKSLIDAILKNPDENPQFQKYMQQLPPLFKSAIHSNPQLNICLGKYIDNTTSTNRRKF